MDDKLVDLLRPGLKLVFCGTAAGEKSARLGSYYAGPGSRFWPILFAAGLTSRQLRPEDFRELLELRIGLTDVAKCVSGQDAGIPAHAFDRARLVAAARKADHVVAGNGSRGRKFLGNRSGVHLDERL